MQMNLQLVAKKQDLGLEFQPVLDGVVFPLKISSALQECSLNFTSVVKNAFVQIVLTCQLQPILS